VITAEVPNIMDADTTTPDNPIPAPLLIDSATDPILDSAAITTPSDSDTAAESRNLLSDPQVTATVQSIPDTLDTDTVDTSGYFDYTYSPPPDSVIQNFDPTQQLHSQSYNLVSDNLNTLTTDSKNEQIRICSLNINGLADVKLGLLLYYMDLKKLDVLSLQDNLSSLSESKSRQTDPPPGIRVGGQFIIVLGKWANRVVNIIKDPTQQADVTGLFLCTSLKKHLMIISSYWPIPALDPTTGQLWNKVLHHIQKWRYTCSPLESCKRFINEYLVKHLMTNVVNTAVLVGISILFGIMVEFNPGLRAQVGPTRYTVSLFYNLTQSTQLDRTPHLGWSQSQWV